MTILKTACTTETKAAFKAVAFENGMTEAALLRRIVQEVLRTAGKSLESKLSGGRGGKLGQVHLRLIDSEIQRVRALAGPAGQSAQGWIVAMIRERLDGAVPFSKSELAELRETIRVIGPIGRNRVLPRFHGQLG